jgi:hypothetical protein
MQKTGLWGFVPLLASVLIGACSSTPKAPTQAQITDQVSVEATVLAVDEASRELTIERPDGTRVVVVAGPEVRNFDRIEAGDKVKADYILTLSARLLGSDEPDTQPTAALGAARAERGQDPAGAIGAGIALTVKVTSVDVEQHLVVFTDPSGAIHAVQAEREEGRRFIAGLKPGDRVELAYGEAVVLSVD